MGFRRISGTLRGADLDDSHRFAAGYHPGATVSPAVLAVAEQERAGISAVLEGTHSVDALTLRSEEWFAAHGRDRDAPAT